MPDQPPEPIEFLRIDGHAVRVTAWATGPGPDTWRMVTITRGTRDAELIDTLLAQPQVTVELPGHEPLLVRTGEIDRRTFGEGQSGIVRFGVTFHAIDPDDAEAGSDDTSLEVRVAALEAEVRALREAVARLEQQKGTAPGGTESTP